ncbi:G patch domain-containing protein 4 [Orchesella cincta]|uniref:G patch domain-containing protein 4 n=1 Tax=Orchesella cincta TaxID=48709 RepID=A0A1D2MT33_ORCCI|nr:G patch domain-containing protein 4 [Orchesella cincta]
MSSKLKSKKKSKKMTVKLEVEESGEAAENNALLFERMEVEEEVEETARENGSHESPEIFQLLEEASGLQLVKLLISNTKSVFKLLSNPELLQRFSQISSKIQKVCDKHKRTEVKALKFISKVFSEVGVDELSCDSDLFKAFLKHGMKSLENAESGPVIVGILQGIFSVGAQVGQVKNPTLGIQMIVSHSKASDIFLESHKEVPKKPYNFTQKPQQHQLQIKSDPDKGPEQKYSQIKTQLLKLWKNLVVAFTKISKKDGTPNDKKVLENSVPYLMQMYGATMSEADQEIFEILQLYTGRKLQISIESLPLFGPKCFEPLPQRASNPLFAHSSRANTILNLVNEQQAFLTAMEYNEGNEIGFANPKHYDFRFLLPLLCNTIDAKNICDSVKVVTNGWIYFIMRGLSFEDATLRNMAFLSFKLLIENFQLPKKGVRAQDIKVWLHFLLSIRKGFQNLGTCKASNLLSVWMVGTWEAVRQATHPMYPRLTNFLFAKPVIDLTVLPDFLPFYNAADGNRDTREWILKVLAHGLKTREDWQVAQRNPTINSLCCSFLVENVFVRRSIIKILSGGARIPEVAQEMVDKHCLLIWISNVPTSLQMYRRELGELFKTLRANCPPNDSRNLMFEFVARKHDWYKLVLKEGMDFARKQLEKFGWKDGSGLGKNEQGMLTAIKPTLKVGKEGMGFDFSKELVDTWWTRAYDDSLKRINVDENDASDIVGVSLQDGENDGSLQGGGLVKDEERPFIRMKKRMMKATFTTFSKGATLSNGEMVTEKLSSDESDDESGAKSKDTDETNNASKSLTDEELFQACGGRTAHKGARFGLKLSGKLARIAAQEEALKEIFGKSQSKTKPEKSTPVTDTDLCNSSKKKKKDKKRKSKHSQEPDPVQPEEDYNETEVLPPPSQVSEPETHEITSDLNDQNNLISKRKQKKHKKRKYEMLQEEENIDEPLNNDMISESPLSEPDDELVPKKKSKKSKKHKRSKDKRENESCELISS